MKKFTSALVASVSLLALAPAAHAVNIDTFDGTAFSGNAPVTATIGQATGDLMGLDRELNASAAGVPLNIQINTATNPSRYAHSQGAGVTGRSSITYDLTGVDLTDSMTANAFRIELISIDLAAIIGVTIGGETGSIAASSANELAIQAAGGIDIPFSAFTFDPTMGGVVELFIDGQGRAAVDAVIDNFRTVCSALTSPGAANPADDCVAPPPPPTPVSEPASLGLLGLGLVGMGAAARRRKA